MVNHGFQPQQNGMRGESDQLPVAAAVRVAIKTVGGWLAATIFLLTISGALPAAINKYCRAANRSFRISSGLVPVRVDRRVDVIEPTHGPHGLTAEQIREDEDFLADRLSTGQPSRLAAPTDVDASESSSAEAATIAAARDDHHRVHARHNLPYRAAPFLARADVIRPGERQPLPYASPDASAGRQPVSHFPPHFNRPPPVAC